MNRLASMEALAPLQQRFFRTIWTASLVANICLWMNDVAAAWMMTSLTDRPIMVALVQTASTLPVFLLGLPSGALADIVDRRSYFMVTQFWVAGSATLLGLTVAMGAINPTVLLLLVFANGLGLAMRWPVYSAIVPELVTRAQLPAAMALNGVAMNASRIVGPIIAGILIAAGGTAWVFALNAVLSVLTGFVILTWKRERKVSALPGEQFLGAIRVGFQYVRQSPRMHTVLLRTALFLAQAAALVALLPLIARAMPNATANTYTALLAMIGIGAICSAFYLPRWRAALPPDELIRRGTWGHAGCLVLAALAPNVWVAMPAMIGAGLAFLAVANTIAVSAQMSLPDWVRARGMSVYQMALMGGSALGAALWGQVATLTSVNAALVIAAVSGVGGLWLTRNRQLEHSQVEDLTPAQQLKAPVAGWALDPSDGPVLTTIEYRIDPERANEFREVMEHTRRRRLSRGALSWELFRDTADPGRFIEYMLDESWNEHLRRFERMTTFDEQLRDRRLEFHIGEEPPRIRRSIADATKRE
ncbi:MAG: MFS transporter [Quisquiliibacterium sp.]